MEDCRPSIFLNVYNANSYLYSLQLLCVSQFLLIKHKKAFHKNTNQFKKTFNKDPFNIARPISFSWAKSEHLYILQIPRIAFEAILKVMSDLKEAFWNALYVPT